MTNKIGNMEIIGYLEKSSFRGTVEKEAGWEGTEVWLEGEEVVKEMRDEDSKGRIGTTIFKFVMSLWWLTEKWFATVRWMWDKREFCFLLCWTTFCTSIGMIHRKELGRNKMQVVVAGTTRAKPLKKLQGMRCKRKQRE